MSIEGPQSQVPVVDEYAEMARAAAAAPKMERKNKVWEEGEGIYILPIRDDKTNEVNYWPMDETPGRPSTYIGDTSFKTYEQCEQWITQQWPDAPLLKAERFLYDKAGIEN